MGLVGRIFKGDPVIWIIYAALCLISVVEVFSATSSLTYNVSTHWAPISHHLRFVFIGFILTLFVHFIPYNKFRALGAFLFPASIFMLLYITFEGYLVNGAARTFSFFGIDFQPLELGKMSVIILNSILLAGHSMSNFQSKKTFWYVLFITSAVCLGIFRENLSTAGILFMTSCIMMYIGRIPNGQYFKFMFFIIALVIAGLTLLFVLPDSDSGLLHRLGTWKTRIVDFVTPVGGDPGSYNYADNQQVASANIAIASSNFFGCMPGNSVQRDFLPQAYSDFIYAIIIEELGLFGGIIVAGLYIFLFIRVGRIVKTCNSVFGAYLVMGISIIMVLQALVNMSVNVGLLPVTGQPLPLISRGGTSFLINSIYIGMILSVSRATGVDSYTFDNFEAEEKSNNENVSNTGEVLVNSEVVNDDDFKEDNKENNE